MGFLHVHQYFQRREENLHTFSPSLSFSNLSCSISDPRCPQHTLCHTHSQSRTLTSIFPLSLTPPCCEFPLPAVWTLVFKQSARLTSGSKEDAGLRAACYCNGVLDLKFDWPNWTKWYLAGRSCPDCECRRMTDSTTRRWHGAQWCRGHPGISARGPRKRPLCGPVWVRGLTYLRKFTFIQWKARQVSVNCIMCWMSPHLTPCYKHPPQSPLFLSSYYRKMMGCFSSSPAASSRGRNWDLLTLPQKQRMPVGWAWVGKRQQGNL